MHLHEHIKVHLAFLLHPLNYISYPSSCTTPTCHHPDPPSPLPSATPWAWSVIHLKIKANHHHLSTIPPQCQTPYHKTAPLKPSSMLILTAPPP